MTAEPVSLWNASGLEWLSQNLLRDWSAQLEETVECGWSRGEWLPKCHPAHAFRLIAREVALGRDRTTSLARLKRLLPIVAGLGNPADTVAILSLFGLLTVDVYGWSEETEVVRAQIERELARDGGTSLTSAGPEQVLPAGALASLLGTAWLGQAAAIRGEGEQAELLYAECLQLASRMSVNADLFDTWTGSVLERIGRYVLRADHPRLQELWAWVAEGWSTRNRNTKTALRLHALLAESRKLGASGERTAFIESTNSTEFRLSVTRLLALVPLALTADDAHPGIDEPGLPSSQLDLESRVIAALWQAATAGKSSHFTRGELLAQQFGDPFWLSQLRLLEARRTEVAQPTSLPPAGPRSMGSAERRPDNPRPHESSRESDGVYFSFFEQFQGHLPDGGVLFDGTRGRRKVKQLLAVLLLQTRYRMVRDVLLQDLFSADADDAAQNYLHVTVHRLRTLLTRRLGKLPDQDGQAVHWVSVQEGIVALSERLVSGVDVVDFAKQASVGHQLWTTDRQAAVELYRQAVELYRPVMAPEFEYEEFMQSLRRTANQHQIRMLQRLAAYEQSAGDAWRALDYLERWFALDPWDLEVLKSLCQTWCSLGEERRALQTCEQQAHRYTLEGEPTPAWLENELARLRRVSAPK